MHTQLQCLNQLERITREVGRELSEGESFGELTATTKWRQKALHPSRPRVGTTVRIASIGETKVGLFVHCQTTLVGKWRTMFPHLKFEGNRAILFDISEELPEEEIYICVEQALTYHLSKR